MNFQWKAKEKPQPPTWADRFTNLHHRLTTWFGVFLLCLTGVPANVTMWYLFCLAFPSPTFLGVIFFCWAGIASLAWMVYTLVCIVEASL